MSFIGVPLTQLPMLPGTVQQTDLLVIFRPSTQTTYQVDPAQFGSVPIPVFPILGGDAQATDLLALYRPSTQTTYSVTAAELGAPALAGNNIWTGSNAFHGALSASSQITSTVATGAAPLVIASTTLVPNLYVARAVLADSATVNANLTGPITSVGNATSIASQTGTGTKFVVDTGPTIVTPTISGHFTAEGVTTTGATGTGRLVFDASPALTTPALGVATATSLAIGGATIGTNGLAVTGTLSVSGQYFAPDGTATQPGISFTSAGDAGVYLNSAAAHSIRVIGGSAGATNNGGAASLQGGRGGATSGNGGASSIIAGIPVDGNGGGANVFASDAVTSTSTSRNGGAVALQAGAGVINGVGGNITAAGGAAVGTGQAGLVVITAGASTGGASGSGGDVNLLGGVSNGGVGGSVSLRPGNSSGGTDGKLRALDAQGNECFVTGPNARIGTGSAIATNAVLGMMLIPGCAGVPSAAPTGSGLGAIALVYDTTDDKLYRYNGTNWKSATFA